MAGYTSTAGYCPGAADVECCTPPPACTVAGVSGICVETSVCATLAGHHSTAGYCPGPAAEECCTP
jgi:lysozyme